MKLKNLLKMFVLMLSLVLTSLAATSCNFLEAHEHSFSAWETVSKPTCTAFGLQKRACECGQAEYGVVEALAHTPATDAALAATCTEYGKTEGSHCATCNSIILAQSSIAPLGHNCNEISVLEEALCDSNGVKRISCTNSGCDYYYDESYSLSELGAEKIYAAAKEYAGEIEFRSAFGIIEQKNPAFVIRSDGIIVTSNYAMDNYYYATFTLGGESYEVTQVLAYSESDGVAVLKVDAADLPCAKVCTTAPVVGEKIYNVGGVSNGEVVSVSEGIITKTKSLSDGAVLLYHDAYLLDEYLGGPVINKYGEVIGLNTGIYNGTEEENIVMGIKQLENLDYSNPITMEEYGEKTYTPVEFLRNWVYEYQNATNDDLLAYVVPGSGYYYSVGVNTADNTVFSEGYWEEDANTQLYVRIIYNNSGVHEYHANYVYKMNGGQIQNETVGYIYAEEYDESTILTYDTYYGRFWTEADLMAEYSDAVYKTLGFLSYCLDTYFFDLNLESFGFKLLSYDRDEDALNKLNGYVMTNGEFNDATGAYLLNTQNESINGTTVLSLSYVPESEGLAASTKATADFYGANGTLFSVSIQLYPTDNGNLFELTYAVYNGAGYTVMNTGWGYLDANTLTRLTQLYCYEFNGMNEYQDGLLLDYATNISYIVSWLDGLMKNVSPELSAKDLGFLFYLG